MTDRNRNLLLKAEADPSPLIILKPIPGSFHLDHSIALLVWPELDQIRQAAAVFTYVGEQPLAAAAQMSGRDAVERSIEESLGEQSPGNERRLNSLLLVKRCLYHRLVLGAVKSIKTLLEQMFAS